MTLTRPLSYDEQRQQITTQEEAQAYFDWLMSRPIRKPVNMDSETYLAGDYAAVGSRRAHEWGD